MESVIKALLAIIVIAVCTIACNRGVYVSVGNYPRNMEIVVDSLDHVRVRVSTDSLR